jgi:hypothetical protein
MSTNFPDYRLAEQYFYIYIDSMKQNEFNELLGNQVTLVQKTNKKFEERYRTKEEVKEVFNQIFQRSSNIQFSKVAYDRFKEGVVITIDFEKNYLSKKGKTKQLRINEIVTLKFEQNHSVLKISEIDREIRKENKSLEWEYRILKCIFP